MSETLIKNIDWLSFSINLIPSPQEKDNHEFVMNCPCDHKLFVYPGTNIYSRRAIVFTKDGRKKLTLLWQPHSRILAFNTCLVEVANEYLYGSLHWVYDFLAEIHTYTYSNLSRIDFCCDFEPSQEQSRIINDLSTNKIYVAGKRDGSMFHEFHNDGSYINRVAHCISWGSKCSNIKWKLYFKSKELTEYMPDGTAIYTKPYIVEQWEANGLDIKNVWRLEVSISPANKFEIFNERITLQNIVNRAFYYEEIFDALYIYRFVTRYNQGHKDRSNDKRVWLLAIEKQGSDRVKQTEPSESQVIAEFVGSLQAAMKERAKAEVQANSQMYDLWTKTAIAVAQMGHLEEYFRKVFGYPLEQIGEVGVLPSISDYSKPPEQPPMPLNLSFDQDKDYTNIPAIGSEPQNPLEDEDEESQDEWWQK